MKKKLLILTLGLIAVPGICSAALWGTGSSTVTQADCSTITQGFCIDSDNGSLYYWDGDSVEQLGTASGDDLGDATASDISALYTGASGYLFSDGTKKTPTAADIGLGTTDNPSWLSVHASGGNLAAANKQVTKAWQSGLSYTADVTSVIHGGQHYIAKTTHTAGSTSEPGVGASWETDWAVASGSGGYTNLTQFLTQTAWRVFYSDGSGDVKELALGSDGEYLKSNGASADPSWATPSGAAHDAVTLDTETAAIFSLSTQQLTLDSQTANYVLAAPNGSAGDPTFRALVAADLPYTFDGDAIGEVVVVHDDGSGNPVLPFTVDIADLTDTDGLFTAKANTSCFASESAFNACFDLTWATGGATNLDGLSDVVISGTPTTNYVLKFNGTNWVPAADATSEGAGYVETPPTYSDATCTKGQYSFDSSYFYMCEATNQWDRFAVTWGSWSNPTPVTPTLTGRVIGTNGTTLTLTGSASLSVGSGGNGGFDVDCSTAGNGITATYASGAPGTDLVYTLGTTVNSGDTCDLDYTQPGNGIEATTGGADLASITSGAITNNSTQSAAASYATPTFVQSATLNPGGPFQNVSLSGVVNGNVLIMVVSGYDGQTVTGVTTSSGSTSSWTSLGNASGNGGNVWMYWAYATAGGNVSAVASGSASGAGYALLEYSGVETVSPQTGSFASDTGTDEAFATGNITTTTTNALLFGAWASSYADKTITYGSGWTQRTDQTSVVLKTVDRTVTATGDYSFSGSWTGGTNHVAGFAALKAKTL